ncbi:uncharacterized protein [Palaemon carinicauda]|uniref:uncharacterized protein n=1 Tax=Palaemon carinicauda TaxID=392227 RepID=UPI0035B69405
MRRFLICVMILGVAVCSGSDIIFPEPPPIKESLTKFGFILREYSNEIIMNLTTLEESLTKHDPVSNETFGYEVHTEIFKHPLLNKFLKTAEEKMSDFAQIFEDDFTEVINETKNLISERFNEKITVLQESVNSVRSNVEELAGINSISELKYNLISHIASQFKQLQENDISLPPKSLLANMTEALDDRIQIVRDRSNNVSKCINAEQQIEDTLTKTMEYERTISQVKSDIMKTTITNCPAIPTHLESAVKMNTETLENISNILKNTEMNVVQLLDTPFKTVDLPPAQ